MGSVSTPPGLGPHLIGTRVVVRRVLPGQSGPTGGPAFTDLLGVMESWDEGVTTVRDAAGEVTAIRIADIVSGKPVPPRPSVRLRVSADEAERRANASWPAVEIAPVGDWLLRASGGFSSRANSVMAVGSPGVPLAEAVSSVAYFYRARGLPPWAQVVVGSDAHLGLERLGWVHARPDEADTCFQVAAVSGTLRAVRRTLPPVVPAVTVTDRATPEWLANDERALAHGADALAVLDGPAEVGFAAVVVDGSVVAKGRVAGDLGSADDWIGITDVWVSPEHRRQGLGAVVMAALLEWGAERGATTVYLQTRGDNPKALALYDKLGFLTHHEYRYLTTG
jgi:ribosomal protein S18 acetylase RimI-like enzyme